MSDCPKCWSTPCMCGHMYAGWTEENRKKLVCAVMPWISVKERLPSNSQEVLVTDGIKVGTAEYTPDSMSIDPLGFRCTHVDGYEWEWYFQLPYREKKRESLITHWMPLPEPPKESP